MPEVAAAKAELDSIDIVEGLVIKDGPQVEVLNGVSLHGGLVVSWPVVSPVTAELTVQSLVTHWREVGLPGYAQFDNDMIFHGTHRYPDALGRVIRLCLSLGVVPVLVPPRETGFQAMIESYNGWWQAKVWSRFQHPTSRICRATPRGTSLPCSSSGRRGSRPPRTAGLPRGLEARPEEATLRPDGLPQTQQRVERDHAAGEDLAAGPGLAQPPGPL